MAELEITKQIGEKFVIANDFSPKLPDNTALASGLLLVAQLGKTKTTTLSAPASKGDTTISLAVNPLAGAALIANPGQATEEPMLVKSVSGAGPFIALLASALQADHASAESVRYDQGATDLVLASPVATVAGTFLGANIVGGLVYRYRVTFLATLTNGQIVRDDVHLLILD